MEFDSGDTETWFPCLNKQVFVHKVYQLSHPIIQLGRVRRKKAFEHSQKAQIYTIVLMRKVSTLVSFYMFL